MFIYHSWITIVQDDYNWLLALRDIARWDFLAPVDQRKKYLGPKGVTIWTALQ
jgi:hypothetical protein